MSSPRNQTTTLSSVFFLLTLWCFSALAGEYDSPYGEWHGQTEYQPYIRSVSDPAGHIVTELTINIDQGGKVVGSSTENKCKLLGLAAPGLAAHIVTLNVTFTGCLYPGFNRTYKGHLSVAAKERHAKFTLQAIDMTPGRPGSFNINATMRR